MFASNCMSDHLEAHEANRQEQFCSMITLLLPFIRGLPKALYIVHGKYVEKNQSQIQSAIISPGTTLPEQIVTGCHQRRNNGVLQGSAIAMAARLGEQTQKIGNWQSGTIARLFQALKSLNIKRELWHVNLVA